MSFSFRGRVPLAAAPWSRHDALAASAAIAVGAAIWFAGWWHVAHGVRMDEQVVPLNVAVVGLVVIGLGQGWFVLRGRRAVRGRRGNLLAAFPDLQVPTENALEVDRYIGGPRFYHRADCVMADGRHWSIGARTEQEQAGRSPCGVCRP